MHRIYLDNAATSWPKPEAVYEAVDTYQRRSGAPAGRGAYHEAIQVQRSIDQTRLAIAQLISAEDPRQVIFTYSGTDALTLAIRGWLHTGDHVITTVCEHNSVLRPLRHLQEQQAIQVTRVAADSHGVVAAASVAAAIQDNTRLIAMVHASNVTGAIQPVDAVGRLARQHAIPFLVDAAQTVGHIPVNVREIQCDLLAAPGHKGMLGPTGTGFLYLSEDLSSRISPVRMGGTGSRSESDRQPDQMPDKFESGNLNVPGIIGLQQGLVFLQQQGIQAITQHERQLTSLLREGLQEISNVQIYGVADVSESVGVVSCNVTGHDPQELGVMLDQAASIQARAGFHCAPLMHTALKTNLLGGTLRLSCGPFTTREDIETTLQTIQQLASG